MSSKKKTSGAFNRKRKLQQSKEDEKQCKALQRFLTNPPLCASASISVETTELDHDVDNNLPITESEVLPGPSTSQFHSYLATETPFPPSNIDCDDSVAATKVVDDDLLVDTVMSSSSTSVVTHSQQVIEIVSLLLI